MHRQLSLRQALYVLAAAPLLHSSAALAQQATSARSDARLEEIIVTAERRTESLQSTAISASVLSGELLEDKGVTVAVRPAVRGSRRDDLRVWLRERLQHPRHRPQPGRYRRAVRSRDLSRRRPDDRGIFPERAVLRHRRDRSVSRPPGHIRRQERRGRRGVRQHQGSRPRRLLGQRRGQRRRFRPARVHGHREHPGQRHVCPAARLQAFRARSFLRVDHRRLQRPPG